MVQLELYPWGSLTPPPPANHPYSTIDIQQDTVKENRIEAVLLPQTVMSNDRIQKLKLKIIKNTHHCKINTFRI